MKGSLFCVILPIWRINAWLIYNKRREQVFLDIVRIRHILSKRNKSSIHLLVSSAILYYIHIISPIRYISLLLVKEICITYYTIQKY